MRCIFRIKSRMAEEKSENFLNVRSEKPPKGLFWRIIERLGLEKQLRLVKRHLGLFGTALTACLFLLIIAILGLKDFLSDSSLRSYLSLLFSDPQIVLSHWRVYAFSILESLPGVGLFLLFLFIALLLVFVRLVSYYSSKFFSITKSIHNKKHHGV